MPISGSKFFSGDADREFYHGVCNIVGGIRIPDWSAGSRLPSFTGVVAQHASPVNSDIRCCRSMAKQKRKLSPAEKVEKRRRRAEFMTVFVNGKQRRVRRPPLIEGMDVDEFIKNNADPIWLHQNEMWEYMIEESSPNLSEKELAMNRKYLLAAELFSYSYANYENHLGIGNIRFDKLMPERFDLLHRAHSEGWNNARIAKALEIEEKEVDEWRKSYKQAIDIIDAPHAAESFRRAVRYSIEYATEAGIQTEEDVEKLVTQICYRAADLAVLLENEGKDLSDYSAELRREKGVTYYWDKTT